MLQVRERRESRSNSGQTAALEEATIHCPLGRVNFFELRGSGLILEYRICEFKFTTCKEAVANTPRAGLSLHSVNRSTQRA
jgi:hypothetical protein